MKKKVMFRLLVALLFACNFVLMLTMGAAMAEDQCNTTYECKEKFGDRASDCKNSRTNNSVCMCGNQPCNNDGDGENSGGDGEISGATAVIPGRIEAEDYSDAYDQTLGNNGGAYRDDDVDIQKTTDVSGRFNVGWIDGNEWLEYDVNVTQKGRYVAKVRVASAPGNGMFTLEIGGAGASEYVHVDTTGGWQKWATVSTDLGELNEGKTKLVLEVSQGGFNVNWIELSQVDSPDGGGGGGGEGDGGDAGILSSTQKKIQNDPNGKKAMADSTMQKTLKAIKVARKNPPASATVISSQSDFDKIKSGGTYVLKNIKMTKGLNLSGKNNVTLYIDGKLNYSPSSGPANNGDLSKSTITARVASNINIFGTSRGSISNNGNASGIRMSKVKNVNVQGLKIYNAHEGIAFINASSNVTANGNVIDTTSARGMWTLDRVDYAHFENNFIANTGKKTPAGDSIDFDARTNGSKAIGNVFIAPGRWGLLHEEGSGAKKGNVIQNNLQLNTGVRSHDKDAEMFIMDNGTQIKGLPDTGPVRMENNRLLAAHHHNYIKIGAGQHKNKNKYGDMTIINNTLNGKLMKPHTTYTIK